MRVDALLGARRGRVVAIRTSDTVMAAARRLRSENVSVLVVNDTCATEGVAVLGILSERDVVQALVDHGAAALNMPVEALMSRSVIFCQAEDSVERATAIMDKNHIRHLPVLEDGALIGVVGMRDMLAAKAASLTPAS